MTKSNKTMIQWLKWPLYFQISFVVILIILVFGTIISFVEPTEFPSTFDGIWWALVTVSTVGFGDYSPETIGGRIIAMIMIMIGASMVSAYFATISAAAIRKQHAYVEGDLTFKGSNHVILIGWNEKVKEMIDSLHSVKPYKQIVLIDETLKSGPLMENVYFVKGDPTDERVLAKANITYADAAIITADQNKNEHDADMNSILILLTLKGVNPSLYCVIEVLTEKQTNNANRAGADEIIKTYKLTSHFIMSSYLAKNGLSQVYSELNPAKGNLFQIIPVKREDVGKTFRTISHELLENESILIGIKKGEETKLNPPLTYTIENEDSLIVFSH
ncbi:potassium channel family protein [Metabacillus niabensis]|uniref:potassium channel family protein n=1 Tax=Metabacillus niabensis TaxID=324854 RepID=UPI00399F3B75